MRLQPTSHRWYRFFKFPSSKGMALVRKLLVKLNCKRFRRFPKKDGILALEKWRKCLILATMVVGGKWQGPNS